MAESCFDIIGKQVDMTQGELDDLLREMRRRQRAYIQRGMSSQDAAAKAQQSAINDLKIYSAIERRNAAINRQVRQDAYDFIKSQFSDSPDEGMTAIIAGSNKAGVGNRMSVDAVQNALKGQYIGGIIGDLERAGLFELFVDNSMGKDIARALWVINDSDSFSKLPKAAQNTAVIIRKWQDKAKLDANRAGAWIGTLDNYIMRQSHDANRLLKAGEAAWMADIKPRLDLDAMFPDGIPNGKELDEYLSEAYKGIVSGIHESSSSIKADVKYTGPGSIAKRVSQSRKLHFKSADDWLSYNEKYGVGDVSESILMGLVRAADSNGLMRVLGTNPETNLKEVFDKLRVDLRNARKFKELKKLETWGDPNEGWGAALMQDVMGRTSAPVNRMLATVGSVARNVSAMNSLGSSIFSQVTDIANIASELRYQGQSFLGSISKGVVLPFSRLVEDSKSAAERKALLSEMGYFSDGVSSLIGSRFSAQDDAVGVTAKLMRLYFKANLTTPWTDVFKDASIMATSGHLASLSNLDFSKLPESSSRLIKQYGIQNHDWNVLRNAKVTLGDKSILSPQAVRNMDIDSFREIAYEKIAAINAEKKPVNVERRTKRVLEDAREDLAVKMQTLLTDRMNYAMAIPDARSRAITTWGSQRRGTAAGDVARTVMQFKSFTVSFMQRTVGREIYGYGARRIRDIRSQEILGLARIMVSSTFFGYLAMTAKDLVKGKKPRDVNDKRTFLAAMQQGSGLGIYGDFVFGEVSRFGQSPVETLTGPLIGKSADLWDLAQAAKNGDDVDAKSLKFVTDNALGPLGLNLFYTRKVMDYLFIYELQESMNPGYLRRMEQRAKHDNDTEYWLPPSAAVR